MRRLTVIQALFLALGFAGVRPAWAQDPAHPSARTLTVPEPPGAAVPARELYVAAATTTTLEFEMRVSAALLTGPGSEHIGVQRLGPHVVFLRPEVALGAKDQPSLTVTVEDGARYVFALVGDTVQPDVEVRVRRGHCLTEGDLDLAAVELLLREPVGQLRKTAFQERQREAEADGVTMTVWGALPLARLSIITFRITSEAAAPFSFHRAHIHSPLGRLKVLGARPQPKGDIAVLVERPADVVDGVIYTLTVSEKHGPRQLIADVLPWPLVPALPARGAPGEKLGPEEAPKADPDRRTGDGKLPRTQVRQRRQ